MFLLLKFFYNSFTTHNIIIIFYFMLFMLFLFDDKFYLLALCLYWIKKQTATQVRGKMQAKGFLGWLFLCNFQFQMDLGWYYYLICFIGFLLFQSKIVSFLFGQQSFWNKNNCRLCNLTSLLLLLILLLQKKVIKRYEMVSLINLLKN